MRLTQLKKNSLVDFNELIESKDIPEEGLRVHLKRYGFIRVFQTDTQNGAVRYWAASEDDLTTTDLGETAQSVFMFKLQGV